MAPDPTSTVETRTLAQRLAAGNIPLPEALRDALMLAEALRKLHDEGRAHGAVTPNCILLAGTGLDSAPGPRRRRTPYTAPEALDGRAPDARGDMFAFGAVLYELIAGRRAFAGEGAALAEAITSSEPPAVGNPALDRLVATCLAKNPAARWPRMQKVLMELKLLMVAARREEISVPCRRADAPPSPAVHAEMERMEARIAARLKTHEDAVAERARTATDAVEALRPSWPPWSRVGRGSAGTPRIPGPRRGSHRSAHHRSLGERVGSSRRANRPHRTGSDGHTGTLAGVREKRRRGQQRV